MASRVVAKANAYSYQSMGQLMAVHQDVLDDISKAIKELRGLVGEGKAFDSAGVNKLVTELLNTYETKVYNKLEKSFKETEKALGKMQSMITTEDTFKE